MFTFESMKNLIYLAAASLFTLMLNSCGNIVPQQPQITENTLSKIPERTGSVKLPIQIELKPYLDLVNKDLPKTFNGKKEECEGTSYTYYFKRDPIEFYGKKDIMSYSVDGQYNIRVNYCAKCAEAFGNDPFCLTPRVYVSCGVGEPLRRIKIAFESQISLAPSYQLISKTSLTQTKVIDPCELSFLHYDASKIIEEEISAVLKDMEDDIDEQIGLVDLKTPIKEVWDALQTSMPVEGMGYLNFRPQEIDVEPIQFDGTKGLVTVNLTLSPVFSTDSVALKKKNLPFLTKIKSKKDFNLPLLTIASYDSINSILKQNFTGTVIPYKKKKITINSAKVLGPVDKKLLFEIVFSGSKKGRVYVLGTPTYDPKMRIISFPDMEFDIRSRDAVLKSAKWLFDKKLTNLLRDKAVYNLSEQIEVARKEIEKQLNTPLEYDKNQFVHMKGTMKDINISTIEVGHDAIRIVAELNGNLSIKL